MGISVFVPAGAFDWQGWNFLAVYFVSSSLITIYLMRHDRDLLRRRVNAGPIAEKQTIFALLTASALDYRFGWSTNFLLSSFWATS
jgi:hypothetical protein